jgi:hypothetical protein
VPPRLLAPALRAMSTDVFVRWAFGHYLAICDPAMAADAPRRPSEPLQLV